MEGLTPQRWQRVRAALERVLDAPRAERAKVLQEVCAGDAVLEAEVEALLAAEARGGELLENPVAVYAGTLLAEMTRTPESATPAGRQLGRYRLIREIARGGMGTVYLAERADGQFDQQVAVKVLRRGLDTDDILQRFLAERQILASLNHPHIARLLDGGAAEDGRPYLVMEYVAGQPIDVYCDSRELTIEARLGLFLTVAQAVQHAHRNLVVHRDLKPSNILVSASGEVKLLDFGIAKLLQAGEAGTPLTRTGVRLLTPEYASPEQLRGQPVTTASDVYQLGLLLYELLSGHRAHDFAGRTPTEAEQMVGELDPPPPSTIVTRDVPARATPHRTEGSAVALARARRSTPERLRRQLRGDLDAITLHALHKEPERRYASVEALIEDVRQYLAGRPVRARGEKHTYRVRKFLRRHRWGVGAAATLLALLSGYALTISVQAARIQTALTTAQLETAKAEQVTEFLLGLFEASRPEQARGVEVTARDLLDRGIERAEALADQPEVQARMFAVIGKTYQRLGLYDEAQQLYQRALALREQHFDSAHVQIAASLSDLAVLYRDRGDYATAESLQRRALEMRRRLLGGLHEDVAVSLDELGRILQDRGDYAAAEPLFREGLEIRRRLLGNDHNETASSLNSVGLVLRNLGRHDEAEPYLREALAINRNRFGDEHPWVAAVKANLALVYIERGAWAAAESLLIEALEADRRIHGEHHPNVAIRLHHLGTVYRGQRRYAEADAVLRQAIRTARESLGDSHTLLAHFLANHARVHLARGDAAAAEAAVREAVEIFRAALPAGDWRIAESEGVLGQALAALGSTGEAEQLVLQSHAALERRWGPDDRRTREAQARLAEFYQTSDSAAEAARWQAFREQD